jgi:hypothetical protein
MLSKSKSEMKSGSEEGVAMEARKPVIEKVDEMSVHTSSGTFSVRM